MIQPFEKIDGMTYVKYLAKFVSDSGSVHMEDRERYEVMVKLDPWDKLEEYDCECKGFKFRKGKLCKHISNDDRENPGILQILKQWNEIQEVPELEEKDE